MILVRSVSQQQFSHFLRGSAPRSTTLQQRRCVLWRAVFNNMFNFQQYQRVYPQTPAPLKQSHYERDFS